MDCRAFRLFLIAPLLAFTVASFAEDAAPVADGPADVLPLDPREEAPLIDPELARRTVKPPSIHASNLEVGAYTGVLSIEDFGSSPLVGLQVGWHFTEDLFLQAQGYRARGGETSYEVLSGAAKLLSGTDRNYTAYDLTVGYDLFPGEAFVGRKRAYNTAFYVLGGIGSTSFGGDDRLTLTLGTGYRLLFTDRLAWHVGFRDHVFASDLTGQQKDTHNMELDLGLTTYF